MSPTFLVIFVGGPLAVIAGLAAGLSWLFDQRNRRSALIHLVRGLGASMGALAGLIIDSAEMVVAANVGLNLGAIESGLVMLVLVALPILGAFFGALSALPAVRLVLRPTRSLAHNDRESDKQR